MIGYLAMKLPLIESTQARRHAARTQRAGCIAD